MKFITKALVIVIVILLAVIIIPRVTGMTIGTVKVNDCVNLYQICENCTYNNISTILYPNTSIAISQVVMSTNDSVYYNRSFCNTTQLGRYIVNGYGDLDGDKTTWVYDFEVTGTGFAFSQARSTFYIGLLALLVFFFILTLFIIPKIPDKNETDDYGMLLSINHLKYFKPILYITAWGLLLGILFTSSNIALAYLGSTMFGNLLLNFWKGLMALTLPGVIIYFIFIIIGIFKDKEMKKMIERGIDIQSP